MSTRLLCSIMAVALLGGCDPAPQADAPKETPAPAGEATTVTPEPAPSDTPPPDEAPAAPAQPSPEAPPPTEPSPTPKPTAANEPALESMQTAKAPAKLSVPVDLKYHFDGDPLANQPVTLHLAAVPRVAGTNLSVSIKAVDGLQVASSSKLNVQKAHVNDAYRQQWSVIRQASVPEIRVLVTMDMPEGLGHGFFSIPFEPGKKSQKLDSVKQR